MSFGLPHNSTTIAPPQKATSRASIRGADTSFAQESSAQSGAACLREVTMAFAFTVDDSCIQLGCTVQLYWALDAPRRKTSTLYADRAWSQARPPLRFLDAPRRTELYACYTHAIRRLKILYAKLDASTPGLCSFTSCALSVCDEHAVSGVSCTDSSQL